MASGPPDDTNPTETIEPCEYSLQPDRETFCEYLSQQMREPWSKTASQGNWLMVSQGSSTKRASKTMLPAPARGVYLLRAGTRAGRKMVVK
jgi:hypothetical protein